jgi:hypothetical protein
MRSRCAGCFIVYWPQMDTDTHRCWRVVVASGFRMGRRHGPLRVPPARGRSSCGGPRLGKHVYRTEPALDLNDSLSTYVGGPFQFGCKSDESSSSIVLPLCLNGPYALKQSRSQKWAKEASSIKLACGDAADEAHEGSEAYLERRTCE